jgi:succinate dehydrogenase flavin-adding protein (antitoxin of CptAB toxin-antitoxin module)
LKAWATERLEGLDATERLEGLSLEDRIGDLSDGDRQALRQLLEEQDTDI